MSVQTGAGLPFVRLPFPVRGGRRSAESWKPAGGGSFMLLLQACAAEEKAAGTMDTLLCPVYRVFQLLSFCGARGVFASSWDMLL